MSDDIDRRGFLRRASIGAAAVSTLAVAGVGVLGGSASADAATTSAPDGPLLDGKDVVAHIIDARKGEISILVGTREINYTDRNLAQTLMRATR